MIKRFIKKLGEIDREWIHTLSPDNIPQCVVDCLLENTIRIDESIVFVVFDCQYWFGITIAGLVFSRDEKFDFFKFSDLSDVNLVYDFDEDNRVEFKRNSDKLRIRVARKEFELICDKEGSVYTIKRLLEFGRSLDDV